ncbi:fruit bromelain-like isoform X2 [Vanessa cardui]|uniref:fruit bromelain-like isoform X1 n=1 Tax=Vanessa cardui TaxID=171605 RepID=UPI001F132F68|nr:fruit bromelain-like isoform X1 [Vanessa cardui]XP_046959969.1 fruit bromelain-like isoform X2 [Vanessa cardui]
MQLATFAFLLITVAFASPTKPHYDLKDAPVLFEKFIRDYNKHYSSPAERARRYLIFVENLQEVNDLNARSDSAVFGITQFSDLTKEEFINGYTGYLPKN